MPKLKIDGTEIEVENGITLLQACEQAGAEIPRFCYHERLSIAGNCRMCLVEVKGTPKPQASCAMSVNDLRPGPNGEAPEVNTRSALVKKAREGVMEFLLINHPLDCPICDQGGECDLQDQAMAYGIDKNRFHENKRAVEDKYIGPLVRTSMNRCIQCTRCVRFTTEVGGVEELGAIGRGEDMEITTYIERAMMSEMQGNVIDLCPVGALTSRPYEFKARPWELTKTETVDVMDAIGSSIRIDSRDREVMRILPRTHDDVNEEWISDKTRFVYDGLRLQRLDRPYIREFGKLRQATWGEAFQRIALKVKATTPDRIGILMGDLCATEEMFSLKELATRLGVASIDCREAGSPLGEKGNRAGYLFNTTIAGLEDITSLTLIGANPRREAPVLNARLRKRWLRGNLPVNVIGEPADLTYPYAYLGAGPETLVRLAKELPAKAERPCFIIGQGILARPDGAANLALALHAAEAAGAIREDWNGFNILHTAAARVGGLDICALPGEGGRNTQAILDAARNGGLDILYLLGADEIDASALGATFVIYQGSHGDAAAHRADVILPGATYAEKSATYVNTEGRPQMTRRAVFPPGDAREDWAIIRALSESVGQTLRWNTIAELRAAMYKVAPHLQRINEIMPGKWSDLAAIADGAGETTAEPFTSPIVNFYMTNPIARASRIMAECSALAAGQFRQAGE